MHKTEIYPLINPNDEKFHEFKADGPRFLLDGKPMLLFSGEMHPQRIPRQYWRHRLKMARAMGLNCVAIYMFWNAIERDEGKFDFTEENDFAAFVRIAQEEGLWVILRPGPYCCAEWDFGGLPPYLLKDPDIRVRCMHENYIKAVERYIGEWTKHLAPLQITEGGAIIMVQVENEYGSYGSDKEYLKFIIEALRKNGINVPLFTCDGPRDFHLANGTHPEIIGTVNFGSNPKRAFDQLKKFKGDVPPMAMEYYTGWYVHWGDRSMIKSGPSKIKHVKKTLRWMIENEKSWNLYMFHGGTSWGYFAGASLFDSYKPDITSYDYGAPLDEAGRPTEQYYEIRRLLSEYQPPGVELPDPSEIMESYVPKGINVEQIMIRGAASLLDNLGEPIRDCQVHSMEYYGHYYGPILYRHRLKMANLGRLLVIKDVHDFAIVFLEGECISIIDRRYQKERPVKIRLPPKPVQGYDPNKELILDILVIHHGRVNYGSHILDRKGITEFVSLDNTTTLMTWEIYPIEIDKGFLEELNFDSRPQSFPIIYKAEFNIDRLEDIGDFFLDLSEWGKGMVWLNGYNLGHYWDIGPQRSLYVPGTCLRNGVNELFILEFLGFGRAGRSNALIEYINRLLPLKVLPAKKMKVSKDRHPPVLRGFPNPTR